MRDFKFPANIKQIGSISSGLKIYVEDYVVSYLNQYTKNSGQDEQLAVLMGKFMIIDEQEVLFVCGAIAGKYCHNENGILKFSDKSWEYVLTQKESYFNELEVVGFALSQPSYGTYLNSSYANYHMDNFRKKYQVLFVIDPFENVSSFYSYKDDQSELIETTGYFIYYEKNKNMQEYMIQNRIPPKDKKIKEDLSNKFTISSNEENSNKDSDYKNIWLKKFEEEGKEEEKVIMPRFPQKYEKVSLEQKRVINLLVGLSAVLFILTFVMGMGLIQNGDRIALLESNYKVMSTSYRNLMDNMKEAEVFASQVVANEKLNSDLAPSKGNLIEENGNQLVSENPIINILNQNKEASLTLNESNKEEDSTEIIIPEFYDVQIGDNLLQISQKFYGTKDRTADIMKINNILDADKIFVGQKLKLPKP